jgi:hypothetical protein
MNGYTLTLRAYCGMTQPIGDDGMDLADARHKAARLLRRRRRRADFPITVTKKGRQWEVAEPEDRRTVPDGCGALLLRDLGVGVPL